MGVPQFLCAHAERCSSAVLSFGEPNDFAAPAIAAICAVVGTEPAL